MGKKNSKGNNGTKSKPKDNNNSEKESEPTCLEDLNKEDLKLLNEMLDKLVGRRMLQSKVSLDEEKKVIFKELDKVKNCCLQLEKRVQRLEFDLSEKNKKISQLEEELDEVRQEGLRSNVRIVGLQEGEDGDELEKIGKKMNIPLKKIRYYYGPIRKNQ